jgi:Holliday junction DNA helicase RuvB
VRDYAQERKAGNKITQEVADRALEPCWTSTPRLDEMDKRILETVLHKFSGGPVGVNSLAVSVGEEAGTIEEVYEPYLIQEGYLKRTPQGRVATERCYEALRPQARPGPGIAALGVVRRVCRCRRRLSG